MKRKKFYIAAAVIVAAAIIGLLIFVFSGKGNTASIRLDGVWKVAVNVNGGVVEVPENEYMVFDGTKVSDYRDGADTPYVESTYKINGSVLELSDVSRTYQLNVKNDSYVSLYTSNDTFITIVKADSEEALKAAFDPSVVSGKWNVTYRATDKPIANEYLVFENGKVADYRNNESAPAFEAEYEWNGNVLKAESLGIEMPGAGVGAGRIILVDTKSGGYVWLLTKAEN